LLRVDIEAWRAELPDIEQHFARFGERLPARLRDQLSGLRERLEG
jgi:phosphoenolpyruvate carboxykinase (GTP)